MLYRCNTKNNVCVCLSRYPKVSYLWWSLWLSHHCSQYQWSESMRFGDSSDYHRHLGTTRSRGIQRSRQLWRYHGCGDVKKKQTKEPTKVFFPEGGLKMMKGGSFFVWLLLKLRHSPPSRWLYVKPLIKKRLDSSPTSPTGVFQRRCQPTQQTPIFQEWYQRSE